MYFSFNLSWHSVQFDIVHQEQGAGKEDVLLSRQNLLNVTKDISQRSPRRRKNKKKTKH